MGQRAIRPISKFNNLALNLGLSVKLMSTSAPETKQAGPMSDAHLKIVLDWLTKLEGVKPSKCRRSAPRIAYHRTNIAARITQPGGGTADCILASINISAGGMALVRRGFLHVGTECRVVLRKHLGGTEIAQGRVVWCRQAVGNLHIMGIKFAHALFVKHFLDPSEYGELISETPTAPTDISGHVMLVDDQEMDRLLFSHHLRQTSCQVSLAKDAEDALQKLQENSIDVILCDLNLGANPGEDAIAAFRAANFRGVIVALTSENDLLRLKKAQKAGAKEVLAKPYEPAKLLSQLAGWMALARGGGQPIYTTLAPDPAIDALIEQYVEEVKSTLDVLRVGIEADNFTQVRTACQSVKGTGAGYGFALLTDAAKDAVTALDASQSVIETMNELQMLESLCRRISAGRPTK